MRIEQHLVTASGRELILGKQFTNPDKRQPSLFQSDELHPAKPDPGMAAAIVREDDLIGRERHSEAVREEDECARRTVADNRKRGGAVPFREQGSRRGEVDEQRDVGHVELWRGMS